MNRKLLEVVDLTIRYKNAPRNAVSNFSININDSECVGIVGESGSGKTTIALSIAGLLTNNADIKVDKLYFQSKNLKVIKRKELLQIRKSGISFIFQDPIASWNPAKKIRKQLLGDALKSEKSDLYAKLILIMKSVGINDPERCLNSYPHTLSGGMLQRIMISGALLQNPSLLLADEPTSALDVTVQAELLELLLTLKTSKKLAILFISHNLAAISQIADRVAVMYEGVLVEEGATRDIISNPMHPYTRNLVNSIVTMEQKRKIPLITTELKEAATQGCIFATRCEYSNDLCKRIQPMLRKIEERMVSCHRIEEVPVFLGKL